MSFVTGLRCIICGKIYKESEVKYTCPDCGNDGLLDVLYDYDRLSAELTHESLSRNRNYSMWRYAPILPVGPRESYLPLQVGWTPLYAGGRLSRELGLTRLYIKDDGRNPSASLKDRASSVGLIRALQAKEPIMTAASTGNAASSLACLCASVGMPNIIFVPKRAPRPKVAQLLMYGATVFSVNGSYDDAFDLCIEVTRDLGWYNRNTGFNPYLLEGKKTAALEIAEQMNWKVPDTVLVSVGDGCIIGGLWKGFYDFYKTGLTDRIPRLIGVQAEHSDALTRAFETGGAIEPVSGETIADSISVSYPRAGGQALRGVRESKGKFIRVTDDEILSAMRLLAREMGIFAEPAGAASVAGLKKMVETGEIENDETVVAIVTGHGLKDIESAMKAVDREIIAVEPDIEQVKQHLREFVKT
ncbi:MAG: threonine synthase [Candidatus Eremiobacteraeota bacterium]|nr:threonine synthase [Candidatus Eremiobacteraeota bacterium]